MLKQVQHDGILDKEPRTWTRSDQRVFVLKRAAALSKYGVMILGEGPRTALISMKVCKVLRTAKHFHVDNVFGDLSLCNLTYRE
ncbi:hypothetical protein PHOSAC3_50022 [Mesotoga infera]|nr:hypothetical protein PHOSAC3_50022 [Mesotoga infera]